MFKKTTQNGLSKFFDNNKVQCMLICRSGVIHKIILIPFL